VSEKPAITGKPVVPVGRKVPALNPNILPVQDKPSSPQFQTVRIDPGKLPLIAENTVGNKTNPAQQGQILPEAPTDDKATAVQPRRPGTPQLTELLADDGIKQGDNFPGKPAKAAAARLPTITPIRDSSRYSQVITPQPILKSSHQPFPTL
jgi:hypothetical protein